jgi:hypothetical protein
MNAHLTDQIEALRSLPIRELRTRYQQLFESETRSSNRHFLFRRIAWRLQVKAEGNLSERARRRAAELADDADLKIRPDRAFRYFFLQPPSRDCRLPKPGLVLQREWKKKTVEVTVLEKGFEYLGQHYSSLSAVATAITGSRWNGFTFFGLSKTRAASRG